jgi:predicted RNA-binding Zn ribbon-like protein
MNKPAPDPTQLKLIGGRPCLDFVNTVGSRLNQSGPPFEWLTSYDGLLIWCRHAGILPDDAVATLLEQAESRPDEAAAVLARAQALREALYRIFVAVAQDRDPAPADLAILNGVLAATLGRRQLVATDTGFGWIWDGPPGALDAMLGPLAESAASVLTSADVARVRQCGDDECAWMFVDTSRNHSRRWCDMEDCGNRAKARRHFHRVRQSSAAGA